MISLTYTHYPLMSHCSDRSDSALSRQINITCSDKISTGHFYRHKLSYGKLLCLSGQSPSQTEFRIIAQLIGTVPDTFDFIPKPLLEGR